MLKVEYSSLEKPVKPVITWIEAKKHLHDVRIRRQKQLTATIDECEKLRNLHKQIFTKTFESNPIERPSNSKRTKHVTNESPLVVKKYSIPRIEYAPIIYRQALPTFELDKSIKLEDKTFLLKELAENLVESSCTNSNCQTIDKCPLVLSIKKNRFSRHLSVSSVPSLDKQAHRVYEKWPDYNHISKIVGYRIDPPPSKVIKSNSISSRRSQSTIRRKSNKSTGFSSASKQVKSLIALNPPPATARRRSSKLQQLNFSVDPTPVILDLPIIKPSTLNQPKESKPKLPPMLCPSSVSYSTRIQTRQWLIKHYFSSNAIRTLPLL